jgi:hypothetical protein
MAGAEAAAVPCYGGIDERAIREHLAADSFFWLDLKAPDEAEVLKLRELFGFHPLALEDAKHFGQRPKLDHYGDHVFMVFYGAREGAADAREVLVEVQMFISGRYLVTVHREDLPALDEQRRRLDGERLQSEQFLLYRVFDALTDSFFPVLTRMDDEIDALEAAVLAGPTNEQLQRLFAMKRDLVAMRKVVTPQRDRPAGGPAGPAVGRARLLPRRVRPPDPHLGPDRLLPGPAEQHDGPVPINGEQPPERGDEAAGDRGHDLPAAVVHHGLLRHELQLAGNEGHHLDVVVLRAGPGQHAGDVRVPAGLLQAQGLDVEVLGRSASRG